MPKERVPARAKRVSKRSRKAAGDAESRFRALVSSIRDFAIFMLDPEGRVATWNEGAERIKGYGADEIIGTDYRRFFTAEDIASGKPERLLEITRRDGRVEDRGLRVRKDGSTFLADTVVTAIVDASGRHTGFAKVTRDVTDRVRTQQAEREKDVREQMSERIRAFAANIPGLAYRRVLRPDGSIEYPVMLGSYVDLLGLSTDGEQAKRTDILAVTHPDDRAFLADLLERSARELSPAAIELRMVLRSGEIRWMSSRSLPRRQPDGSTVWDAVAFDVTERRRAEARLRFLQSVSLAIAEAEDFETALLVVLREVCATTGWNYGEAWIPDPSGSRLIMGAVWHPENGRLAELAAFTRTLSYEPGQGLIGAAWQSRQSQWMRDLATWPEAHPERVRLGLRAGVMSASVLPVLAQNEILAVMSFAALGHHEEDAELSATISSVATQLGTALRRKQAEQALRESEERLDWAQEIAAIGSFELDVATDRFTWSKAMYRIRKVAQGEFDPTLQSLEPLVHPEDVAKWRAWFDRLKAGVESPSLEYRIIQTDGAVRRVSALAKPIANETGKIVRIAGTMQDITERRQMEEQLVQAQKMEAIGSLSGGMAHDFNNLLGVIIGNLDLLSERSGSDGETGELLGEALDAALDGADLIRRMLAFARRQSLQLERVDVNARLAEMAKLLSRTLGGDIEIALDLAPDVRPVTTDRTQLEAAITNLVTNARDAMPKGGRLTFTTRNRYLDADYAVLHQEVTPGDYVMIEATDTGTGISSELLGRIFEPFFTTKDPGKGSGLGLSMIFGFMKQIGGHVSVYSEPGEGTTFRLYLPLAQVEVTEKRAAPVEKAPRGGGELILVVEDNPKLRSLVVKQLAEIGYRVLEAENAEAALAVLDSESPDLLFSDVVMPGGMDGFDLAREATRRRPQLRILLSSGFPEARVRQGERSGTDVRLLSKPYRREELARALRATLEDSTS